MNATPFSLEFSPQGLAIRMASTMENIDRANTETRAFLRSHGLDAFSFPICLGMREALTNAVRHGNAGIPQAMIRYTLRLSKTRIILEIQDEGPGFDWRTPRKSQPDAEHGRGMHIMKSYFHIFRYNEKGNHLTLEFAMEKEAPLST